MKNKIFKKIYLKNVIKKMLLKFIKKILFVKKIRE